MAFLFDVLISFMLPLNAIRVKTKLIFITSSDKAELYPEILAE